MYLRVARNLGLILFLGYATNIAYRCHLAREVEKQRDVAISTLTTQENENRIAREYYNLGRLGDPNLFSTPRDTKLPHPSSELDTLERRIKDLNAKSRHHKRKALTIF